MITQAELVENVRAYNPDADEEAIASACSFATEAHKTQTRASGDPYISHPLEVARILASLKLDNASIITGLLHDTVEDTSATLTDIRDQFGEEVAALVDGVTKLTQLETKSEQVKQAENFRKLVIAMSEDIRVLLVKLCDRLHNMRTLHHVKKKEKRTRIARETLEIYATLAERMGMRQLKEELQDLAFNELYPEARASVVNRLQFLRRRRASLGRENDPTNRRHVKKRENRSHGNRPRETPILHLEKNGGKEHRFRTTHRQSWRFASS